MRVKLAYGRTGLEVELPEGSDITVVHPKYVEGLSDPGKTLSQAMQDPVLSSPLKDLAGSADKIGIIINDISRATPYDVILPAILGELEAVPDEDITLFIALGTHRENSEQELSGILGESAVKRFRIVQNSCEDKSTQIKVGTSSFENELWINRELYECDLKVLTGFIEPHFFAGFSGGGKAVLPGMAGLDTIMNNHSAQRIDHERSVWGVTEGNPIAEEVAEAVGKVGNCFLVNVTMNKDKEVTGVFAGDVRSAHREGCDFARTFSMAPVPRPFDIVVTSNAGYPLDLNLYQSVKGMSAAAQIVKEGGAIIVAADCWDGVPEHGLYSRLLGESKSPKEVLEKIRNAGEKKRDQWQAQIQAKIQLKADVFVRSNNLTDEQIIKAQLLPSSSVEATIEHLLKKYGPKASICVLPEGPLTIPYIELT